MATRETFSWDPLGKARGHSRNCDFWHVAFTGRPDTIQPIKNFLDRHAGHREFLWTTPTGKQGIYRSFDIIVTHQDTNSCTLSTVFEKVPNKVLKC